MSEPEASPEERYSFLPTSTFGAALTALFGFIVWSGALDQKWRTPISDFYAWAAGPMTLLCAATVVLSFRQKTRGWTQFWTVAGVLIAVATLLSGLWYEEWLEYQPGGRGYTPGS